jgi:hypothetical protein
VLPVGTHSACRNYHCSLQAREAGRACFSTPVPPLHSAFPRRPYCLSTATFSPTPPVVGSNDLATFLP